MYAIGHECLVPYTEMGLRNSRTFCGFDVVVIGGSAGSSHAILEILNSLPATFPAAIIVCQHFTSPYLSLPRYLKEIQLKINDRSDDAVIERGLIYIPPRFHQMMVTNDYKINFNALLHGGVPSINLLFSSVADTFGDRAIGVVLSGGGQDCAKGVISLKRAGGKIIVQRAAASMGMPSAALATGCVDFALSTKGIISALISMVMMQGVADLFRVPLPSWAH